MSQSRRNALEKHVEVVYRLSGPWAARCFVDEKRMAVRCPRCRGKRTVEDEAGLNEPCPLCMGQGALRPRSPFDDARTFDELAMRSGSPMQFLQSRSSGRTTSRLPNIQNIRRGR